MKIKVLNSFSVPWLPNLSKPGEILEVPDERHSLCRELRLLATRQLVEILEDQRSPYARSKSEVRP